MKSRHSLARRIVIVFVLLTLVVSSLFSLVVMQAVSYTEDYLSEPSMRARLNEIVAAAAKGQSVPLDKDMQLFIVGPDGKPPLPAWLARVGPGFQEASRDGLEHHVLVNDVAGTRYVLVQDQEEFERREAMLLDFLLAAILFSVIAAWALGARIARRVIAPVVRLAGQVQHREQLLPVAPPLASDYAPDEVGTLAAAFDTALGKLQQALQRERLFTSDVSHELRTPLMVIESSCELMLAQGVGDARQETTVRRILASCVEMRELVATFLELARAPESQPLGDGGEAGLQALADELIARFRGEAQARGLELSLELESGDEGRYPAPLLRAVLSNLLRNAIHYTDKGFVRLVLRRGGFSVCDSGVGIPREQRDAVFLPFVRGDATRGDGLGLGLSLVQRICQRQGWRIRLEESRNGGCEFRVDFYPA
ncbi:MAG: HAMP domain-containing histidine kinase [Rhodocyclaceae bacterium]|jgi:signal transduction histidine kinase|nr:HAMP domain-containing histidine kinase [Rhodocyclaceae bacterium]MCO5098824.1 HAMP domain-containing histidine kinase [Rhodocyclaceae bacterium]MCZ7656060.1 HAMP domain-containing histidine kinase [Rhodocyclaceae bacterium]